ncbi:MAG: glycosyl hydrolase family 28-related protein, partial [Ferruginibacter sp.]
NSQFSILLFASIFLTINTAKSQIIPKDRRTIWEGNAGVAGGIPNRAIIGATINAATYGTGIVDASAAIGAAIDACPEGQVVFIPAGTYRVDTPIYRALASFVTIRGAGMGKTILKAGTKIKQVIHLGKGNWPRPTTGIEILGSASKGKRVLTVRDASSIIVGNLVRLEQQDLSYVISVNSSTTHNFISAVFKVTAKTATTVTVTPSLPFTYNSSPKLVQYPGSPLVSTGVEDLTLDCNVKCGMGLEIEQSWGCWVKNIEIINSTNRQMFLVCFVSGEIRHNYTHATASGGPEHEGIDFYEDGSFNLVEDNISYNGGFPGIILGDSRGGCTGNVIAYNFCYNTDTGYPNTAGMDISVSHGPHNMMNLVEGNIAGGVGSDGYFGSTSHITILRNWLTATHPTCSDNLISVNIGRWNNYFNLVGNILGTSAFSRAGLLHPENGFNYADQVIYKIGYPNMGNNGFNGAWGPTDPPDYIGQAGSGKALQEFDHNVIKTMVLHGNFDYKTNAMAWDPTITDHNIPVSYFRRSKPAWFGKLSWPPFDPASPPGEFSDKNISLIPAGYRFIHGVDP